MAFTVEDGNGVSDANSYVDVTFADGYFGDRVNAAWAALSTEDKQKNLILATDYVDARFGGVFKGTKATDSQALCFPRQLDPCNLQSLPITLPANLKKAVCEYAIRASSAPLAPDLVVDPSGFEVSKVSSKVGPIEESTEYATRGPGSSQMFLKPYPAVDMLLRELVRSSQGRVIRG